MRRAVALLLLSVGCSQTAQREERNAAPSAPLVFLYPLPPDQPLQIDMDALAELVGGPYRLRFLDESGRIVEEIGGGRGILTRRIASACVQVCSASGVLLRIDLDPLGPDRYPSIPNYQCVNGSLPFACFLSPFPGVLVFPGQVIAPVPFLWTPFGPVLHCFRTNLLAGRWVVGFVRFWHWVLNTIRWTTIDSFFFQWRNEWRSVKVDCTKPIKIIVYGAAITGLPPRMNTGERATPQLHMSVPEGVEAKFRADVSPPLAFENGETRREFEVRGEREEPVTVSSPKTATCALRLEPTSVRFQEDAPGFLRDPLPAWTEPRNGEGHCRIEVIRVIQHGHMTVKIERRWRLDGWTGHWDWVPVLIYIPGAAVCRCCRCVAPCVSGCRCCSSLPACPPDCCGKPEPCERCRDCPCLPVARPEPKEKLALLEVWGRPGAEFPDHGDTVDPRFRLWYLWIGGRLFYLRPAQSAPPNLPRMAREADAIVIELPRLLWALLDELEDERKKDDDPR